MPSRRRSPRLGQQASRRLLTDLLRGRGYADSVSASVLADLCGFGVLDDVLAHETTAAGRDRMRTRYETVFSDTVIGIYEDRLDGTRAKFPDGFYDGEQGRANAVILIRNLVENVLQIPVDEVANRLNLKMFSRHGLRTLVDRVFGGSPWAAIDAVYPGRFHPWEFSPVPHASWQGSAGRQRAIEATRWLFETKLKWPLESLAERTSTEVFRRHGLGGMLSLVYRGWPFRALDAAYPGRFRPWQLRRVSTGYWAGPRGRGHSIAATRWLVEDVLGWDEAQIQRGLTRELIKKHGLDGMLMSRRYKGSILAVLQEAYPGRDKATQRLLSDLLRGRRYADSLSAPVLVDLCCSTVLDDALAQERTAAGRDRLRARYQEILADTVISLYESLLDGSRRKFPPGFHDGHHGVANGAILVRNLVENVLRIPVDEVVTRLNYEAFSRHGLLTLFRKVFDVSPWAAIEATYPGRFHPWERPRAAHSVWRGPAGRQRAIEATRWLFESKLKWPVDRIAERTSQDVFYHNGLGGMLSLVHRGSPFRALDAAYPGRFKPWELPRVPNAYWTGPRGRSHSVAATRWLVEEALGWNEAQIRRGLTREVFDKHGLLGMLSRRYKKSIVAALEEAYPGRYKRWEFEPPHGLWTGRAGKARAIEATRWLVEDVLGWDEAMVRLCLTTYEFSAHRLANMVSVRYGGSTWKALEAAYPGRYRKEELFGYRQRRGLYDRLMRTFLARLRILTDATRMDAAAVCRRHHISSRQLRSLRKRLAARGVAALLPEPKTPVISVDTQRAVLELTYEQPSLSAAQVSGRLRARGMDAPPPVVLAVWRSHRVLEAKASLHLLEGAASYPSVAAAAHALGVSESRIRHDRRRLQQGGFAALCYPVGFTRDVEDAILALVREEPALGQLEILRTLRARRVAVTDHGVHTVLTRYGLRTAAQRLAAGGGLPKVLRDFAVAEPVLRKLPSSQPKRKPGSQPARKSSSQPARKSSSQPTRAPSSQPKRKPGSPPKRKSGSQSGGEPNSRRARKPSSQRRGKPRRAR